MRAKQDYSYSLDKGSHLINVKDALKGIEYHCPCCGDLMIPRQGKIRRWHFAHKGSLGNCSYESYLHKIAKLRIRECFNKSSKFFIQFEARPRCNVKDCPVGRHRRCIWNTLKKTDLKQYYNSCEEEVAIGKYRADLLISNLGNNNPPPIVVEIYVTHKSTEEKINSKYRIIEIRIDSEEDINQIVKSASINESKTYAYWWGEEIKDKIRFYNFKTDRPELPDEKHQEYKYLFWIDSERNYYHMDNSMRLKCLSQNSAEIENAVFLIEARFPISSDFAFYKLLESGLNYRYCTMCKFYKWDNSDVRKICELYKSKGTNKYPYLSIAMSCPHFKLKDYSRDPRLFEDIYNQESRITIG